MNIHCLGDSVTASADQPEIGRWTVQLQMHFEAWRPGVFSVYNNGVG
jgi:lysophospholipase L1-like esterase